MDIRCSAKLLAVLTTLDCGLMASANLGATLVAQTTTVVSDELACPRCSIRVQRDADLQNDEGDGGLLWRPQSMTVDGRGRVWVLEESELPRVFDARGRFLRSIGRRGGGPGEFFQASAILALPGDSVLIFDRDASRGTVLTPDLVPSRYVTLPQFLSAVVLKWPGQVLVNGLPRGGATGWPFQFLSLSESPATLLSSFGPPGSEELPGMDASLIFLLARSAHGGFWSAPLIEYRVMRWSSTGVLEEDIKVNAPWFPGRSRSGFGTPTRKPEPSVAGIQVDARGLVWVFLRMPSETWKRAWELIPPGTREVRTSQLAVEELFTTVVEVIDPSKGVVVSRLALDEYVLTPLPGGRAALYSVDRKSGTMRVSIVSLTLEGY